MFLKPRVEVNAVVYQATPELDRRDAKLGKERDPDTEIGRRLLLGETADRGRQKLGRFHFIRRPWLQAGVPQPQMRG